MKQFYTFLFVFLLSQIYVYAQPANDAACTAASITLNGGCATPNTVVAATASPQAVPSCWLSAVSTDVWYTFVATDDSITISTDYYGNGVGDLTDTQIALYSSSNNLCTGTLTQVGCDDDGGTNVALNSIMKVIGLTVGNTYFIRVDGYSTNVGDFCLTAFETLPPSSPEGLICSGSTQAYPSNICLIEDGSLIYNNTLASSAVGTNYCGCDNETAQVGNWIKFTANSTTTTLSNETAGANAVAVDYTVFTGNCTTCSSCTSVAKSSSTAIATTVGTTYYVLITPQSGSTADIRTDICVTGNACTLPVNDECADALAITACTIYPATTQCATADKANCSGSTENNIWYTWTAPAAWPAGQTAFFSLWGQNCTMADQSGGIQLSIFKSTESCGTITGGSAECNALVDQNSSANMSVGFPANPNTTYYISLDGEAGDACTFFFELSTTIIPFSVTLVTQTDVACFGGNTGAIDISTISGVAPYTYAWSNGSSTQDISGLVAGSYTVTATEAGGCTATGTYIITQNPIITITPTLVTNVACPCESTGAIDITVTGGVSPYTYLWSTTATTEDITALAGGVSYTVTVTDSKSCTKTSSIAVTVPSAITISLVSSLNPTCNGVCNGSATYQASGGTGPYDYSNNGGGAYQFSNQAGNVTYSSLCAGAITITVRDANNCVTPP